MKVKILIICTMAALFLAVAGRLYGLLEIAASSYGFTMNTYVGQNFGAKKYERIRKGVKDAIAIGIVTALFMSLIMVIFGKFIISCFVTGNKESVDQIISVGYQFLLILAAFFPFLYILYIIRASIQGTGNSVLPMISSIVQLVMRTGCALFLTKWIGERGVFWGEIFAWIGADLFLSFCYCYIFKQIGQDK